MRRDALPIVGILALCLSCGAPRVAYEAVTLPVDRSARSGGPGRERAERADGRDRRGEPMILAGRVAEDGLATAPALRVQVPWPNERTMFGWGALRVWGHPREDELRVHAIVDAPVHARRWGALCELRVSVDGREVTLPARYVGSPLSSGQYDAVRVDLEIAQLREIALADAVRGSVCGDPFELGDEQRTTLRGFVERFDDLAVPRDPARGVAPPSGPDVVLPGEEQDLWPTEA